MGDRPERIPREGKLVVTRTRDGGKSFDVLTKGLPQSHAYDVVYRHALALDEPGERLAFGSTTGGLWVSEDQGDTMRDAHAASGLCGAVRMTRRKARARAYRSVMKFVADCAHSCCHATEGGKYVFQASEGDSDGLCRWIYRPRPSKNLKTYRRIAQKAGKVWRDHGALEFRECVADDVKVGKWTSPLGCPSRASTASCLVPPRLEDEGVFSGFVCVFGRPLARASLVLVWVLLCDI